jgi:nitrile hydratase accessory protein
MKPAPESSAPIPEMGGELAFPRKNGEPVFDAPWQSRAFGMVVRLNTEGVYVWDEFKERLIARIAAGDTDAPTGSSPYYYEWVEAFWQLLIQKGLFSEQEMLARTTEFETGIRQEVY